MPKKTATPTVLPRLALDFSLRTIECLLSFFSDFFFLTPKVTIHTLALALIHNKLNAQFTRFRNPQLLADSAARLMHLRVYDSRDSSRQLAPSPSLCYSLTHAHRSIGYRNRNPQLLADSAARLMYSRVYDNRDSSHQSAPSPSLYSSLTHAHSTLPTPTLITITCTQVLWFLERLGYVRGQGYPVSREKLHQD
jgi:hypothetical protein